MTKYAIPTLHPRSCHCPTCVLRQWDDHHDALADDTTHEREYQLYLAAVVNTGGVPFPRQEFDLLGWLESAGRRDHLAWQAAESQKLAREIAQADGPQSSLEGGYSASSDLCGPSQADDSFAILNEFAGTRYELLGGDQNDACPSLADVEAIFRDNFVLAPYPGRVSILPTGYDERKAIPVATGALDYFPLAIAAVAQLSRVANDQHNPGEPLHWAREKSTDEANTLLRHFMERGARDADGQRHSAKVAWRALALLQKEIEQDDGVL